MGPFATMADQASGSVNPYAALDLNGPLKDVEEADGDRNSAASDHGKSFEDGAPPALPEGMDTSSESILSGDANDPMNQEIKGLLNELDRMNAPSVIDNPPVRQMSTSEDMYAPTNTGGGGSSGGRSPSAAVANSDSSDGTETGVTPLTDAPVDDPLTDDSLVDTEVEDEDSMLVMLGGAAGGTGDTMNDGDINLEIVDYGQVTVAHGKVDFVATSDWDGTGEPPDLYAETFLDVYDADLVFFYKEEDQQISEDGTQISESSTLYVVAIDFEDGHPLANEFDMTDDNGFEFEFDPGLLLAAFDGTPEDGYFSNPLLDGIPFEAFSRYYGENDGEVSVSENVSTIDLTSANSGGNDDSVELLGDIVTIEDVGSFGDLYAQVDQNELSVTVAGLGPDTFTSIDGGLYADDEVSGLTGLAIGIA